MLFLDLPDSNYLTNLITILCLVFFT